MSDYSVSVKRSAAKTLKKLPMPYRKRLKAAIDALAEEPRPHGHKVLDTGKQTYRIRIGPYRLVYQIQDARLTILVVKIADRKEVYQRLNELLRRIDPPSEPDASP
ncbi:MAG: type II toxin-antitoxin system RelE/ParE family toxin [Bacteroidota bacterium]